MFVNRNSIPGVYQKPNILRKNKFSRESQQNDFLGKLRVSAENENETPTQLFNEGKVNQDRQQRSNDDQTNENNRKRKFEQLFIPPKKTVNLSQNNGKNPLLSQVAGFHNINETFVIQSQKMSRDSVPSKRMKTTSQPYSGHVNRSLQSQKSQFFDFRIPISPTKQPSFEIPRKNVFRQQNMNNELLPSTSFESFDIPGTSSQFKVPRRPDPVISKSRKLNSQLFADLQQNKAYQPQKRFSQLMGPPQIQYSRQHEDHNKSASITPSNMSIETINSNAFKPVTSSTPLEKHEKEVIFLEPETVERPRISNRLKAKASNRLDLITKQKILNILDTNSKEIIRRCFPNTPDPIKELKEKVRKKFIEKEKIPRLINETLMTVSAFENENDEPVAQITSNGTNIYPKSTFKPLALPDIRDDVRDETLDEELHWMARNIKNLKPPKFQDPNLTADFSQQSIDSYNYPQPQFSGVNHDFDETFLQDNEDVLNDFNGENDDFNFDDDHDYDFERDLKTYKYDEKKSKRQIFGDAFKYSPTPIQEKRNMEKLNTHRIDMPQYNTSPDDTFQLDSQVTFMH